MNIVCIGDISQQIRGVSYDKAEVSKQPETGLVPVLRANNIGNGEINTDDLVYVPSYRVRPQQYLIAGDVLIAASSGSIDVVGKAAPIRENLGAGFGAFCKVLRPTKQVWPSYFAHYFQTQKYRQIISGLAAGANINNLKNEHLDNLEIPLPPLPEQRRIAAVLDAADALRAKRRAALGKLDALLQSVFLEMFGDPVRNERGFEKASLKDVLRVSSGKGLTASEMSAGGHYPVYGGNGINGYHDEYIFDCPTIIIGRVGVYCGVVHVTQPKSWVTDNALYVYNIHPALNFFYLEWALRLANLNQYSSQAAQPLISGGRIYPIQILVPPIEKQLTFQMVLDQLKTLQDIFRDSSANIDAMFLSLQQRAFRGEL